ncbi:hypothetical protein LCGC14_1103940 [marine sediment metagenome]|uniref:Uncharacterized protein n=1 Tax=marine sediment metagenome TaxID=412755 RepID=A0A0F9PRY2_9ZZZZ
MPRSFSTFVRGIPAPQGSKRAFITGDRAVVVDANPKTLKDWRAAVAFRLQSEWHGPPLDGALHVELNFALLRPKSVSEKRRPSPTVKPDLDKLERAVLDALTGIVIVDDALVVELHSTKEYSDEAGVSIFVRPLR